MTEDNIRKYHKILKEGIENMESDIKVDMESEYFPIDHYLSIIEMGERNIERMITYCDGIFNHNRNLFEDLKHYPNVDPVLEIGNVFKTVYLEEFGEEIIIEQRNRTINKIIRNDKDVD